MRCIYGRAKKKRKKSEKGEQNSPFIFRRNLHGKLAFLMIKGSVPHFYLHRILGKEEEHMFSKTGNTVHYARRMTEAEPEATAALEGSPEYPNIRGTVLFYRTLRGVLVVAEVFRLPYTPGPCASAVYGFHIHEGGSCTGNEEDPLADTGGHFNPKNCPHPYHAGDMPPLFGNNGYAWSAFVTNRFLIDEVRGRTVVVHAQPDDFTTQPSGNAGQKIACGVIK